MPPCQSPVVRDTIFNASPWKAHGARGGPCRHADQTDAENSKGKEYLRISPASGRGAVSAKVRSCPQVLDSFECLPEEQVKSGDGAEDADPDRSSDGIWRGPGQTVRSQGRRYRSRLRLSLFEEAPYLLVDFFRRKGVAFLIQTNNCAGPDIVFPIIALDRLPPWAPGWGDMRLACPRKFIEHDLSLSVVHGSRN
jgi:hypothetical protein